MRRTDNLRRATWSFEDAERVFYERTFKSMLDARNARYEAQRHHERVQSMDDYNNIQQQKSDDLERAAHVLLDDDLEL